MCVGGRNLEADSCPSTASSHLLVSGTGLSFTEGLGMGQKRLEAEGIIRTRAGGINHAAFPGDRSERRGR